MNKSYDVKTIKNILSEEINKFNSKEYVKSEEGRVVSIGDGIATVSGLANVMLNEIVEFETGVSGIVLNLEKDHIGVVLLGKFDNIEENTIVYRTHRVFSVPVGFDFVGRVVDANAEPIDGKGPIKSEGFAPVEKIAPGVMKRQSVDQPLETGILSIDAMFPIGKGQRELIIGDRQTGKTTVATDAIINQKGKDVYCIYVAIGQKNSTVAALVKNLEEQGAMEYTTVVSASASDLPALQYIAPYTGVTLAEHLMSKGKDVLIVYDDLSKHAIAYRTLSLLLRRPPGREAFPGDVFYLHSRLLERACRLNAANGGGSITALPIIETLAGDISAYIPTNVISITDGQIFMMTSMFNSGQRPAIDAGLSVSRVGGAAQIKSVKSVSGSLKLELANYRELDSFSQFGSDLDKETKSIIHHGKRCMLMLRQLPNQPLSQTNEAILMLAIKQKYIDAVPEERIQEYKHFILKNINQSLKRKLFEAKEFTKEELEPMFKVHLYDLTLRFLGYCTEYSLAEKKEWAEFLHKIIGELRYKYKASPKNKQQTNQQESNHFLDGEDHGQHGEEETRSFDEESQVDKDELDDFETMKEETQETIILEQQNKTVTIEEPVKPEPVQKEPVKTEPVKEEVVQQEPVKQEEPKVVEFVQPEIKPEESIIRKKLKEDDKSDFKTNVVDDMNVEEKDYFFYEDNGNQNTITTASEHGDDELYFDVYDEQEGLITEENIFSNVHGDPSETLIPDDMDLIEEEKEEEPIEQISFKVNEAWDKNKITAEEVKQREEQIFTAVSSKDLDDEVKNSPQTIMISVSPSEAKTIIEDGKSVLFFKLLPVQEVKRVIVYVTKKDGWNGGVIGEFDLEAKIKMSRSSAWSQFGTMSTLRKKEFDEYYRASRAVSIMRISRFVQYSSVKKIESYKISRPPSSFTYLK